MSNYYSNLLDLEMSNYDKEEFVYDILSPRTGQLLYLNNKLAYIDKINKKHFSIRIANKDILETYSICEFYDLWKSNKIDLLKSININNTTYTLYNNYIFNNKTKTILKNICIPYLNNEKISLTNKKNRLILENEKEENIILLLDQADKLLNPIKQKLDVSEENVDYRKKYTPEFRTDDGHYVRSQGELIIDNWLYSNNYFHEYEKKIIYNNQEYLSDFYLKKMDLYIEYFGLTNNSEYTKKSEHKKEIYKHLGLKCIYLYPEDIKHIQDILQKELIKINDTTNENDLF